MTRSRIQPTHAEKELIAELLKERIYATIALLAVLISIDTTHTTPLKAGFLIAGTVLSLWLASVVAGKMARRVVFQGEIDHERERRDQLRRHNPMLAALAFPLLMLFLAFINVLSLRVAINISVASALLLLVGWSALSARSLRSTRLPLIILVALELAIGLGVVALKLALEH